MAMSKRGYQAIARAIHGERASVPPTVEVALAFERIIAALADVLDDGNPRFDRARFLEACETGKGA